MDNLKLAELSNNRPESATMYSELSEQYLRKNEGEIEVYCKYGKNWQKSKIKDLKLAKVVELF